MGFICPTLPFKDRWVTKSVYSHEYLHVLRWLVNARKAAQFSQQQLADLLQRPQSFISKYENGERRLDVVEFVQVARVLKADPAPVVTHLWKSKLR